AASRLRLEKLANDTLCDGEARKDVRLEHATNDVDRHLRDGAALADASVAQERVERPAHRFLDVTLVENVQLVDDERVAEAELLDLPPQIGGLRPELSRREHAMSGLRESDGGSPAQTATRSRDQYAFHGLILKCWRFGSVDWLTVVPTRRLSQLRRLARAYRPTRRSLRRAIRRSSGSGLRRRMESNRHSCPRSWERARPACSI